MYINPFLAGILATILSELVLLLIFGMARKRR